MRCAGPELIPAVLQETCVIYSQIELKKFVEMSKLVGIDVGGTFTDYVYLVDGELEILKLPTDREKPGLSIRTGLDQIQSESQAPIVHGTTIATNAILERRGAVTALVSTAGFEDVLELARQQRPELYQFSQRRLESMVPAQLRFGVRERTNAVGETLLPLSSEDVDELIERLVESGTESVAISLLFSFANDHHEQEIEARLRAALPELDISASSQLLPEYREYERTATTVANAFLSPVVRRYLEELSSSIGDRPISIMHSGAGLSDLKTASREAAKLVLSGPAAGVIGAFDVGRRSGLPDPIRILSLDMGGTSADVCLCEGHIPVSPNTVVGDTPIRFPAVDVHSVGAGGGSIAWVDDGGVLRVGPQSAGAQPGPACYGLGGTRPTVTDANLVVGRMLPEHQFGGSQCLNLNPDLSETAIGEISEILKLSVTDTALGILQIANSTMERALRKVSVARGYDPRIFTLIPFGGAGPLHACALATSLNIPEILLAVHPGVLSAVGLCLTDAVYTRSLSILESLVDLRKDPSNFVEKGETLASEVADYFLNSGQKAALTWSADVRYKGQSHELILDIHAPSDHEALSRLENDFHRVHEKQFGYSLKEARIELVTLRVAGRISSESFEIQIPNSSSSVEHSPVSSRSASSRSASSRSIWFDRTAPIDTPVLNRFNLKPGTTMTGPALILQTDTTILVEPGWEFMADESGLLRLSKKSGFSENE
ncbi:MAG: hydantoinase/oxoprolinase family protein [Rhodothermia bacterium]|nr:MAG: hydantoinase/oxoprolinase family protein [Rhodothermia bacterium]